MLLLPHEMITYPKTCQYLIHRMPKKVLNKPKIVRAMAIYGQLDKVAFTRALTFGSLPIIKSERMTTTWGAHVPKSNTIRLGTELWEAFEKGRPIKRRGVDKLTQTLLHELVHWGDAIDGKDYPGEEGTKFEIMAYGFNVP